MNCAEFQEILHDLDRPGTTASSRDRALAHAESCSSCGHLLTEAEALDFGLRTMAMPSDRTKTPLRVEATLLNEFRKRHGHVGREAQQTAWYAAVIGVAAVAMLVVGVMRVRISVMPDKPSRETPFIAPNVAGSGSSITSGVNASPDNDVLNGMASSDEGTGFVRLPYADDAASLEGGAVIRVTMPRSALASWGLPISSGAGTERIPAELVVSADGTPQAIRLISQESE